MVLSQNEKDAISEYADYIIKRNPNFKKEDFTFTKEFCVSPDVNYDYVIIVNIKNGHKGNMLYVKKGFFNGMQLGKRYMLGDLGL